MIPDDNVIWSFHSYDAFLLTHQGATWAGDFIPLCHRPALSARSLFRRAELDATLDAIRARIDARGAMVAARRHARLSRRAVRQHGHAEEAGGVNG